VPTLIRVLKSHAGADGRWQKGDIYDADSAIATSKIAAGLAEAVTGGAATAFNNTNFAAEATAAAAAVDSAQDDVDAALTALVEAESDYAAALAAHKDARVALRVARRAAAIGDLVPPTGYAIAFNAATYTLGTNANAVRVNVTGAEVGAAYAISISSSGGGTPVTRSGTVASASFNIQNIDCSGLTAGALTASLVLTDTHGNAGAARTGAGTLAPAA
jgi:hypothetical protein